MMLNKNFFSFVMDLRCIAVNKLIIQAKKKRCGLASLSRASSKKEKKKPSGLQWTLSMELYHMSCGY